jgi:hypothetical protein
MLPPSTMSTRSAIQATLQEIERNAAAALAAELERTTIAGVLAATPTGRRMARAHVRSPAKPLLSSRRLVAHITIKVTPKPDSSTVSKPKNRCSTGRSRAPARRGRGRYRMPGARQVAVTTSGRRYRPAAEEP